MTNNQNERSQIKGWQILSILSSMYPCSTEFRPYLESLCQVNATKAENCEAVKLYAQYVELSAKASAFMGRRTRMPTGIEIASICARSPIIVRIYSFYGNFVQIAVDSWTTAQIASELVAKQLDIEDPKRFVVAIAMVLLVASLSHPIPIPDSDSLRS